jgi:Rap1a immunity proteins
MKLSSANQNHPALVRLGLMAASLAGLLLLHRSRKSLVWAPARSRFSLVIIAQHRGKMRGICGVAAMFLLLVSIHVKSGESNEPNAAAVLKSCLMSLRGSADDQNCMAYINGVVAGVLIDQIAREQGSPICLPNGMPTSVAREKIEAFLRVIYSTHPDALLKNGNAVVSLALMDAFPCGRSN